MKVKSLILTAGICVVSTLGSFAQDWKTILEDRLPEYGHRNWIIVADAAYPKQSAPGIETICTGDDQLKILKRVLKEIESNDHIKPVIMLDSELDFVQEKSASGVEKYRADLKRLLAKYPSKSMSHEDLISKLDKSSKLFNVLLLKTDLTIPYTSVFIELDCGYWNSEKENELRDLIKAK